MITTSTTCVTYTKQAVITYYKIIEVGMLLIFFHWSHLSSSLNPTEHSNDRRSTIDEQPHNHRSLSMMMHLVWR